MAKALRLEFATASGLKTQMTIDDDIVKQDLDEQKVRTAMESMIASNVFATSKGESYASVVSAAYVERTETELFNDMQA